VPSGNRSLPNAWTAALLSAIAPGAGQWHAGDKARGKRLILVDVGILLVLLVAVLFFQSEVLKAWASLSSLALIMVGNLVLLSYRAWAAYDAYYLPGVDRSGNASTALLGLLVAGLLVAVPHVALGYLNVVQYSLISDVFVDTPVAGGPSTTVTTTPGQPAGSTTTTPAHAALWDGLERLNILLLGADVGSGRKGIRTDTMIVVSIDPETGGTVMVSVPRNLSGITLPEGMGGWECGCFPQLINDLWYVAEDRPDLFPGDDDFRGPNAMKAAIGKLVGLDIQYYALVTLDGFVGIVDALGGVDIEVPNTLVDETYPHEDGVTVENVVIEAGEQHLDGHLALAYARIRRHADDFARMRRQRCVLGAVIAQSSPLELLARYGSIAEVLKDNLLTDIPRDNLVDLIDLLPKVDLENVAVLHIDRDYIIGTAPGRDYYDEERILRETQDLIANPALAANSEDGLSLTNTCD
jgi:LCP family protein required for cell wall assembly